MTDIIFSLDTEDFTSNISADAILEEAQILRSHGIKGGFQTVGLLAKQLGEWGRENIKAELKNHEICFHSYGHSYHPTINEYTDIEDYTEARRRIWENEGEGAKLVRNFFGNDKFYSACPPGNALNYVAMYAYADMGIPIYAGTNCDTADGRGVFMCNVYHTKYTVSFEEISALDTDDKMRELLDTLATQKRAIVYTHPNNAKYTNYWDLVNYYKKNLHEWGDWEYAPRKTEEETALFYERMNRFIELMKADNRFNITSYSELANKIENEPERRITAADIPWIRKKLREEFATIEAPMSLSVSDIFLACRDILVGKEEHICGKVYGFLDEPYAACEELPLSKEGIIKSAKEMNVDGFLPTEITVDGHKIGPADWLFAAMDIICAADKVVVTPREQLPSLDVLPSLKKARCMKGWISSDDFVDVYLTKRLKLQVWTMRFLGE